MIGVAMQQRHVVLQVVQDYCNIPCLLQTFIWLKEFFSIVMEEKESSLCIPNKQNNNKHFTQPHDFCVFSTFFHSSTKLHREHPLKYSH